MVHLTTGTERGENQTKLCHIHRLVAEAWIPVPPELSARTDLQVDHIIPVSNGGGIINPETGEFNLRWVTPEENNTGNTLTNINRQMATLKRKQKVYVYTEDLQLVHVYDSTADAARELNKSQGNIASCCQGSLPRYLGYIWSYEELTDIKQRKELEEKMHYQWQRNRESTIKASSKCQKNKYRMGRSWYHLHKEEALQKCRDYYWTHKEEILQKQKERRNGKQKTTTAKTTDISEGILPEEQG